ncbi:MAG: nucleotidyltransferase domain-containing protein [Candidatus Eisenbacteria bacterium]|nr:nucleotidyltransferase domain-containing protein [Candidatus Eisenbacteria bacterium]
MDKPIRPHHRLLDDLQERAKELNCLYEVESHLGRSDAPRDVVLQAVVESLPPGFQHPEVCRALLVCEDTEYYSEPFHPTPWVLSAPLEIQGERLGRLSIYYTEEMPPEDVGPFLAEEERLVDTVANRLSHYLLFQKLRNLEHDITEARQAGTYDPKEDWRAPIHLLRESDRSAYLRVARRLINHLTRIGVEEARTLLSGGALTGGGDADAVEGESNVPSRRWEPDIRILLGDQPFELAARHLSGAEILSRVQRWMVEDKAGYFIKLLNSQRTSLPELADAIRRFHLLISDGAGLPSSTLKSLRVSLTQRLLTEQLDFVRTAKDFVEISDFVDLIQRLIMPPESHGKLGGKGAGLLLAHKVLQRTQSKDCPIGQVKIPKTWYIASDGLLDFVGHNDLQDVIEQKFKEIDDVRNEYPSIIRLFKSSSFTPRVISGLSQALDDFGETPLIVRSSSLLEDRLGTAFSGKYKSLFLANQGTKEERLAALMDAIAEVYASTFGPDPIEYRREHGLLEFNEEMGILVQEVVGSRLGRYYLPAFAGVAFSNNEFRWSPRIKREDGLVRIVAGLGTRAVDRVADDYPVLAVPGKPNLRANVAINEIIHYAPRKVDLINLETRTWETVDIASLLKEYGRSYPAMDLVFSVVRDDMLQKVVGVLFDPEKDELAATFQELFTGTPFLKHMRNIMSLLQKHLGTPVDVEFAHDGRDFYLLQCRPQSYAGDSAPAPIPKDIPELDVFFTASRYVSNGFVPDVTHLVYVDPEGYGRLETKQELLSVGRVIGRLNKVLPKRQFILMGPGRWGSRGDLKLGVSVTYADINNTAMLVEIARRKGSYVPDLSFGTHFFQDLVESRIRYLPLYPDDPGVIFNDTFLRKSPNLLAELVPEHAALADTVRVIDVPAAAEGRILRVLQNAELDEAVAFLVPPAEGPRGKLESGTGSDTPRKPVQYWQWRMKMAERIAEEMDGERFGVKAMYVFGSTKNATAGPGSDIDLLIHFHGGEGRRLELLSWLEGWSLCLAEMNYLRTGYRSEGLLDAHLVTDEDIAARTSYAVKIGAVTDSARELPMGKRSSRDA